MTNHSNDSLYNSIYQNMQLKDTEELLTIWERNDRDEWTDEAFSIIHDILIERLGSIPPQNTHIHERKLKTKTEKKVKTPLIEIIICLPIIIAFFLTLLIPKDNPFPSQPMLQIILSLVALFFFSNGIYWGWRSWFKNEQEKQRILDRMIYGKKKWGIFYRISTLFIPDNIYAVFAIISWKITSIVFIIFGVYLILLLIAIS